MPSRVRCSTDDAHARDRQTRLRPGGPDPRARPRARPHAAASRSGLPRRRSRAPLSEVGPEEDYFVNYGFLPRAHYDLMHPRTPQTEWSRARDSRRARFWSSYANTAPCTRARSMPILRTARSPIGWRLIQRDTQLLDEMHYRGLLRVARRAGGTRLYAAREVSAEPRPCDGRNSARCAHRHHREKICAAAGGKPRRAAPAPPRWSAAVDGVSDAGARTSQAAARARQGGGR